MKNQKFGIEIEMTGISRKTAAKTIAEYFNTRIIEDHDVRWTPFARHK